VTGGALVLAAGCSRRFGGDKRKYLLDGRPLLRHTLESVVDAGLACRVCIRPEDGDIPLRMDVPQVSYLACANAAVGMGATLAEGVGACADWDGLLVVLGDMAWVRPDTLALIFGALTPGAIVRPVYDSRPGQPVAFAADFFPELRALTGDRGGRDILRRNPHAVVSLAVDDAGIHRDLDAIDN
jgi:CTP:molybdopterin cytidylyltransferase MocA